MEAPTRESGRNRSLRSQATVSPHVRILAWLLVVGWCAALLGIVLTGERAGDLASLRAGVADGSIGTVEVAGGLPAGSTGNASVELHWTERGLRYVTEARQVRGPGFDTSPGTGSSVNDVEIRGDVADHLRRLAPSVEVERIEPRLLAGGLRYSAFGWEVAGLLAAVMVALSLVTVLVLVTAREHWRATAWAWFWLILLLPPLGALVYLLAGGPTGVRRPGPASGKLTGGWAFLLAVAASSLW